MYRTLRNIHLILGLGLFWVVIMYGLSAVQMAHRMRIVPVITESEAVVTPRLDARPMAAELMAKNDISGEMGAVVSFPGGYTFPIVRAGGVSTIRYEEATGKVKIRTTDTGFWGVLNRLHHFHGLHNQTGARNAWGWLVLFASLGLFVLGGTGVYMWFKLHQDRGLGMALLGANLLISIALLVALRLFGMNAI